MKKILKKLWNIGTYNGWALFWFELSYRIAASLLMAFYAKTAISFALKQQGISYMTAENFGKIVSNPWTVLVGVLGIFFMLFFLHIEVTAIFSCFDHAFRREKVTMLQLWQEGFSGSRRWGTRHRIRRLWYLVLAAPYLCVHLLVYECASVTVLQFVVKYLVKLFHGEAAFGIAVAISCVLGAFVSFFLPFRFFEPGKEREILKKTLQMLKKHWKRALSGLCVTQLFIIILSAVLYLLSAVVLVCYATLSKSPSHRVSAVVVYGSWLKVWIGIIVGALALVINLLFLYALYRSVCPYTQKARIRAAAKPGRLRQIFQTKYMTRSLSLLLILSECALLLLSVDYSGVSTGGTENVRITAHRGGARMAPENTLSALAYAVDSLSDYAEIDVQETKDGELVLLHDNSLKRTTGLKANIWKLTLAEVRQLDAGVKFNKKFRGEQIPTLREVLEFCDGKIRLNIEVKYNGHNKNIVKKVVKVIEECDFIDQCVVTSMNYNFLKEVKKIQPEIRTGYITTMAYGDVTAMQEADFFSIKHKAVNEAFVRRAHAAGKQVHTWTVNSRGEMKRMIDCGADNIITDDPELVRKVLTGKVDRNPKFGVLMKYALK